MDGESFLAACKREREHLIGENTLLYEYYWERNYPQTPTNHAVIGEDYKYIRYHGVWDQDELYHTKSDPKERKNLFNDSSQESRITEMNKALFDLLADSSGENMPLLRDRGTKYLHRKSGGSRGADFPPAFVVMRERVANERLGLVEWNLQR
jgi:N-acetylglucosamine-6-sulfatase